MLIDETVLKNLIEKSVDLVPDTKSTVEEEHACKLLLPFGIWKSENG